MVRLRYNSTTPSATICHLNSRAERTIMVSASSRATLHFLAGIVWPELALEIFRTLSSALALNFQFSISCPARLSETSPSRPAVPAPTPSAPALVPASAR